MIWRLLALGLVIGANNLAAALALGPLGQVERRWRIVTVFGGFEFGSPLLGLWLGQQASSQVADLAGWFSQLLLAALGVWMIISGRRNNPKDERLARHVTTWGGLLLLGLGLSLDNLVVGFSLGLMGQEPLWVASTIAIFSVGFTWLGLQAGSQARRHWEHYVEMGAGILLVGLAAASVLGWL